MTITSAKPCYHALTTLICISLLCACGSGGTSGSNVQVDNSPAARLVLKNTDRCDPLISDPCLFPFPNDYFTVPDNVAVTGRRVNISSLSTPVNALGVSVKTDAWNMSDGFSPGGMILSYVPDVDLDNTGAPSLRNLEQSLDSDSPVLLIDAETGEQQLVWAELDANVGANDKRALIIRPAKNLQEGHRYIVALRNLKNIDNQIIEATELFKIYRDQIPTEEAIVEARREHMESLLTILTQLGVQRSELYLVWDFTVASTNNITGRLVHMRDEALAKLADAAPEYAINEEHSIDSADMDSDFLTDNLRSIVRGTIKVPNYLDLAKGVQSSVLNLSGNSTKALPEQLKDDEGKLEFLEPPFVCVIPHSVIPHSVIPHSVTPDEGNTDSTPAASVILMAHGLFQSKSIALEQADYANQHGVILCAMDWMGMSKPLNGADLIIGDTFADVGYTNAILNDISLFPSLPDRLQQAVLNNIFLTRLIQHPDGFSQNSYFQHNNNPLFNRNQIYFEGLSQGSIVGGAFFAVDPTIERAAMVSAGMNFSFLLRRSSAWQHLNIPTLLAGTFDQIGNTFNAAYSNTLSRTLLLAMIQMLWDRAEINGYANHFSHDPLTDTPKSMLIQAIVGDQTVSEISAEILSRTIGAQRHSLSPVADRHVADHPYYGISLIETDPATGNLLVVWDRDPYPSGEDPHGTPLQPPKNKFDPTNPRGLDPHSYLIDDTDDGINSDTIQAPRAQRIEFFTQGQLYAICNNNPCLTTGYQLKSAQP